MTDERIGDALWAALARLPPGSGVVFRHFDTAPVARAALFARIAQVARRRRLLLVRAGRDAQSIGLYRAHSLREAIAARRCGAKVILVSPLYPTRTHPGKAALGPLRAARIAHLARIPAIALGGMTRKRFNHLKALGFVGWAAIDGLTPGSRSR